jgi:hypothetical protein
MATKPISPTADTTKPSDGTAVDVAPTLDVIPTPTLTFYQKLADDFMTELDNIAVVIPKLEAAHVSTASFVRGHLNVSNVFLATTVTSVEQTEILQRIEKLDVQAARDTLQFLEAFRSVLDKVTAFQKNLKFTMDSRKAALAASALQVYEVSKGLARDPGSASLASVVANMKRDLARPGRPKLTAAARKAAAEKAALTPAKPTGAGS